MINRMKAASQKMETIATKKDFRVVWFSGTGAGGQHRNKHQNCCRITHIPTGMTEVGQNNRERSRNQCEAFQRLGKRVADHYCRQEQRERYGSVETVRTYHEADNRVKDHASGLILEYTTVMGGKGFADMIEARRNAILLGQAMNGGRDG